VYEDASLYDRYLQEMALVTSELLQRNYFLVIVWSSLGDDDRVVPEILKRLGDELKQGVARQIHVPRIRTWRDLVASLQEVDFLIASRLHSVILGFVTQKPTVAISFDPKVDWVMEDLGQSDCLLHIRDFRAEDVIAALDDIEHRRDFVVKQISSYLRSILSVSTLQYDTLANFALAGQRCRA
jgi:polysaccharide pyruvyl transferase WcaK-like protein